MDGTQTENEARAERAYRTLLVFSQYAGDETFDPETAAVDLMADVLHMLDLQYGTEPEAALRSAWHHFMAERVESA